MPLSLPSIYDQPIAQWRNSPLREVGYATGHLNDTDCHFGLSFDIFSSYQLKDRSNRDYGLRAIDIDNRGGIVAEKLWEQFNSNGTSQELSIFIDIYNEIAQKKPSKITFPQGAMAHGHNIGGTQKYKTYDDKSMLNIAEGTNHRDPKQYGTNSQKGARWSKVALEATLRSGGKIHFHLEGLEDIAEICDKSGNYAYNITSRELRHVYKYWDRFLGHTIFYNGFGYHQGNLTAIIVETPWPN